MQLVCPAMKSFPVTVSEVGAPRVTSVGNREITDGRWTNVICTALFDT